MINVCIVGVGNCCSSLLQALEANESGDLTAYTIVPGLERVPLSSIKPVAAFDVDSRKVGQALEAAIFAPPNCTTAYNSPRASGVTVRQGAVLDGLDGPHVTLVEVDPLQREPQSADVVNELRRAGADVVLLYLPVGSQRAAEFYAGAALEAGCSLVNCTPAVLANDPVLRAAFRERGQTLMGDDLKSCVGSTAIHQALLDMLLERGVEIVSTHQLNVGGNTDFLNMRDHKRSMAKRVTKAAALAGMVPEADRVGLGPSDYIPYLRDRKIGHINIQGRGFLSMPVSIEMTLKVEDSPNAAPVALDALRTIGAIRSRINVDLADAMARLFKRPGASSEG